MPPKPLIDLGRIDIGRTLFDAEEIRSRIPQRFEMEMLHRIVLIDRERNEIAGVREIGPDEFWARGHFPGHPVLPGVLLLECAGQLSAFLYAEAFGADRVMGFAACESVKFRGTVEPGDTLLILGKMESLRSRISQFAAQGIVDGEVVFEGTIVGMPLSL